MRYTTALLLALLSILAAVPLPRAQTADWTIISTPRTVRPDDQVAVALTIPAGATGEALIVLPTGLRLLSAAPSSGTFADGRWQLDGTAGSATLVLLASVERQAKTDADVTVTATWNGIEQRTATALIGQSLPPATPIPPGCSFLPVVQHAAD